MSQTNTALSQTAIPSLSASPATRFFLAIIAGSVLLAISAHISFPLYFTPVPFTLQPMAVLLLGLLLEPAVAFATLVAYLVEGASGLPVFTPHGPGGILHLVGPSGGFLFAYPFAALLVSKLYRSVRRPSFRLAVASATAGSVVYFASGAFWLAGISHQPMSVALKLAVWPFVVGDALKIVLAAAFVTGLTRFRSSRQNPEPAI